MDSNFFFTPDELLIITGGTWRDGVAPERIVQFSTDSRADLKGMMFIPIAGERFDGHDFIADAVAAGASCVMASRDVTSCSVPMLCVADTLTAYQKIAQAHRRRMKDLLVIGITGSSGKTSTKEIFRAILSAHYGADAVLATEGNTNNHVGVPQNLLRINGNHRVAVIEMGTNHPGEIIVLAETAEPNAAAISCIGASHLEFFGDIAEVAREKSTIFKPLRPPAICVVPEDSPGQFHIDRATASHRKLTFGRGADNDMVVSDFRSGLTESSFRMTSRISGKTVACTWPVPGRHQALNAAAAALLCEALGIPLESIAEALSRTQLPGMRSRITRRGATDWINDAYNANPESMVAGLQWLAGFADPAETLLVLGDMREMGMASPRVHRETLEQVQWLMNGSAMVLIGSAMTEAAESLALEDVACFPNAEAAAETVQWLASKKKLVFLKGSRGMALEKVEPKT